MINIIKKFFLITIIFFLTTNISYGHKMVIEHIEEGVIKVYYSSDITSNNIKVLLYNSNNELIKESSIDDNGYFTYMEYMDIAYIIAEDGVGHRVKWTVGETISYSKSAFWYKFIIIICTFISIAYISSRRVKKKISISLQ